MLHYICTASFTLKGSNSLALYRMTYQVTAPYGFVDLVFLIEPDAEEIGYI